MIKVLNTTTNIVWTLPDPDALKLLKEVPEIFKAVDAGLQKEEAPKEIDEKTVKELVMKQEDIEEEEKAAEDKKEKITRSIDEYSYAELRALCFKLGLSGKGSKQVLYTRLKEELDK